MDFRRALTHLCVAHVESYVRERYDSRSLRIFRVILDKSKLEQKQVRSLVMQAFFFRVVAKLAKVCRTYRLLPTSKIAYSVSYFRIKQVLRATLTVSFILNGVLGKPCYIDLNAYKLPSIYIV